ncbi:vacuolar protein sorting-associated protein [Achlya hypogyna]|uniref:Vacuolar protein sorting-associated protein n=1 Tax=Achlya hypogyna TaxID=1202772 RepID=A0A1V9ZJR1_ACHHY|nr:vacuolar protein sorting-associated protein [Achlya hypogyna]
MFERYIEGLVVEYFSAWLEGFDKEGMRVALFSGKICFRDLKFKKDALDSLQLPVVLKEGRLGTLFVKVPWQRLGKESVHVVLEDLYLVLGPATADASYDERARWTKQHEIRMRELLHLGDDAPSVTSPRAEKEKDDDKPTRSGWKYKDKLVNTVLDNLTFELKRIHVRYEDASMQVAAHPLGFGISIDELKIATTNANGHVTFMDRAASHTPFVHKLVEMRQCYVYWDLMKAAGGSQMTYLIEPFNTTAKITENHDASSYNFIPKYRVRVSASDLVVAVAPQQCKDITNVLDFFSEHETYLKRSLCRQKRPTGGIRGNARAWWQYAIASTRLLLAQPMSYKGWRLYTFLYGFRSAYIPLHARSLGLASWKPPLDAAEAAALQALEDDPRVSAETLVFFRFCAKEEIAMEKARRKHIKDGGGVKGKSGKWSVAGLLKKSPAPSPVPSPSHAKEPPVSKFSLFSPTKKAEAAPVVPPSPTAPPSPALQVSLSPIERQLVYVTVGKWFFEDDAAVTPDPAPGAPPASPRSAKSPGILVGLDFAMARVQLSVAKESVNEAKQVVRKEFVRFNMADIALSVQHHLRVGKARTEQSVEFSIGAMELLDATVPAESPFAVIFGSLPHLKTKAPLVQVKYDAQPALSSLTVSIDPARLLYHKKAVDKIRKYVTPDLAKHPSTAAPAAEKADDEAPPIHIVVHASQLQLAVAGADDNFVLLHLTGVSVHSTDLQRGVAATVDAVDSLLVPVDQLGLLGDDATLQNNCRILKRFQCELSAALETDPLKWKYHVTFSPLIANLLEAQLRSLLHLGSYLVPPTGGSRPPAVAVDAVFEAPAVQVRIVGREVLRSGLQLDAATVTVGVTMESTGTVCIDAGLQELLVKEAVTTTTHRAYTFQGAVTTTLLAIAERSAVTVLLAPAACPAVTVGLPHVECHWNYHVLREVLACFVAPLPLAPVGASDAAVATLHVRVASGALRLNPSDAAEIVLRATTADVLLTAFDNSDVTIDVALDTIALTGVRDAAAPPTVLLDVPQPTTARIEMSGAGALALRDGAASYAEAKLGEVKVVYFHAFFVALGAYVGARVSDLFTWLYLTREGLGRRHLPPALIRCKVHCVCDQLALHLPLASEVHIATDAVTDDLVLRADKLLVTSARFGTTDYEQYRVECNVALASVMAAPGTAVTFVADNRTQRAEISVPHLTLDVDKAHVAALLALVEHNVGAPPVATETLPPVPAADEAADDEIIVALTVSAPEVVARLVADDGAVLVTATLEATDLHLNQFTNGAVTLGATVTTVTCADPTAAMHVRALARAEAHAVALSMELSPDGGRSVVVNLDTVQVAPHVQTLLAVASFLQALPRGNVVSAAATINLSLKLAEYSVKLCTYGSRVLSLLGAVECQVTQSSRRPVVNVKGHDTVLLLGYKWPLEAVMPRLHDTLHLLVPEVGRALCPGFGFEVDMALADRLQQVSAYLLDVHGVLSGDDLALLYATAKGYLAQLTPTVGGPPSAVDWVVTVVFNCASLTLVAPQAGTFAPMMRLFVYNLLLKDVFKSASSKSLSNDVSIQFSDEPERQLSEKEGLSLWCFNGALGAWEPCLEPWSFHASLVLTVEDDTTILRASFHGSKYQKCHLNLALSTLTNLCCVLCHLLGASPPVDIDGDIACGVYICNDSDAPVAYWGADADCRRPHDVPPHATVPLQLATETFFPSDQTISLCWDAWQPLNDVRLHSAGQFVYTLQAKDKATKKSMQVLLQVAARDGLRTLTISSVVRVFNDGDVPIRVGVVVLDDDASRIVNAGEIPPRTSLGLPMALCPSIGCTQLVFRPVEAAYDWSAPLAVDAEAVEAIATCPLPQEAKKPRGCTCLAAFSATVTPPNATSDVCTHCDWHFRVVSELLTPRNRNALSQHVAVHVLAPVTLENRCPVPITMLMFTTKKVPPPDMPVRPPQLDEEIEPVQIHLVQAATLAPNEVRHVYAASLLYKTYASMALVGQKWSPLKPLHAAEKDKAIWAVEDAEGRSHFLHWALVEDRYKQRQAVVYPGFILHDHTQLSLVFDVDASRLTSKKSFISFSSGSKNNLSASDSLETDVIHASLQALAKLPFEASGDMPSIPYMLSGTNDVSIRIDRTRSLRTSTSTVHLDAISDSVQNCHRVFSDSAKEWHDIGVLLRDHDHLTKLVTFVPRYMVLNNTPYALLLCPSALLKEKDLLRLPTLDSASGQPPPGVPGSKTYDADRDSFSAFHWSTMSDPTDPCVRLRPADATGWKWSGKFSIHDVGETSINAVNRVTGEIHIVRVQIRVYRGTQIYVVLSHEAQAPLYRIVNHSDEVLHFHQFLSGEPSADRKPTMRRLLPTDDVAFGWDEPYFVDERSLSLVFTNGLSCRVHVDQIADDIQHVDLNDKKIFLVVYLDGLTKVLYIKDSEPPPREHLLRATTKKPVLAAHTRYIVDCLLPATVVSLIDGAPAELLTITVSNVTLIGGLTPDDNEVEITVDRVQIDNQTTTALFPVAFAPTNTPEDDAKPDTPAPPFFHLSLIRLFYSPDIEFFKYFSALVQPAALQLDAAILLSMAQLITDCVNVVQGYFPHWFVQDHTLAFVEKLHAKSEPRVYFETLQLHPIKLCVTFTQSSLTPEAKQTVMAMVPLMFRVLQTNLANIDNASLHLNALHVSYSFSSISLLVSSVRQHYTTQCLRQIYSLIGSAEILGNPLGLVSNLGSGVKDFFYEPAAGMVQGPGQFVKGLSRGTESLVKNSVYGTFNAASKLTGSISTGLVNLSMDKTYIQARTNRKSAQGPTNVGAGLLLGTKQLGQGIFAGVSGVITKPVMGAYHNGLTGFVEGVGKGIIGVAVKPTAGILDLAAQTTAGITYSAATHDKKPKLFRQRLPRMMATSDRRLTIYSDETATIAMLLSKLQKDALSPDEQHELHVMLPGNRVVLATSHQLMALDMAVVTKPRLLWAYPVRHVLSSVSNDLGVNISIQAESVIVVKVPIEPHADRDRDRVEELVCKVVSQNNLASQMRVTASLR